MLGTLISDFQTPELWEINTCSLWAAQPVIFCISGQNGLIYWAMFISNVFPFSAKCETRDYVLAIDLFLVPARKVGCLVSVDLMN